MRLKSRTWMLISLVLFGAAALFWHWGDVEVAKRQHARPTPSQTNAATATVAPGVYNPIIPAHAQTNAARATNRAFAYRLSNTSATVGQLERNNRAILLRNALIDTARPLDLNIPEKLKNSENPGSWIVQSRAALNNSFYSLLRDDGAQFVSYIPNNAALVTATASAAARLKGNPMVQAVIPYEPYYKLDSSLIPGALGEKPLTNDLFGVTGFLGRQDEVRKQIEAAGGVVVGEDRTPFGPEFIVRTHNLLALVQHPGVMEVEAVTRRHLANDLSRPIMGVASDSLVTNNYLGLTGTNVVIAVNDSGADAGHPDLTNRVFADTNMMAIAPWLLSDSNTNQYGPGHGTHVVGIIIGDGTESSTLTNVQGSVMPGTNNQFRGKAPGAKVFIQPVDLISGPLVGDAFLQESASKTNALINNNSWTYTGNYGYSMASASYDAATRDAQPSLTGSQPALYVFAAGNDGGGDDSGGNAFSDSILAPATGKNVITVGALESLRNITNEVAMNDTTNAIWADETDSATQVASFSSRGNVGIGVEGEFGRFKPDVVAPGVYIVSTRSTTFPDPVAEAMVETPYYPGQSVKGGTTNLTDINIPEGGVLMLAQIYANSLSPVPFPTNLVILADSGTNAVTPRATEFAVTSGEWTVGVFNPNSIPVNYDLGLYILITNATGNMFEVMSNMNASLGKGNYYRYESGTSMAAPAVSGTLALMQEFFQSKGYTNPSPALLKALLINGARLSQGDIYDYQVNRSQPNDEGWGVVNLPNSVPANMTTNSGPTQFFDQSPDLALATGQSCERDLTLSNTNALNSALRVTLVWTDPPGNPAAGIKLVNDLDLVVSNKDTGEVFVGNNFMAHSAYTQSNSNAPSDVVNNVENVYLDASYEPLSTNYAVIVTAKRVNVNAVTAHTNAIVQDYALVISSAYINATDAPPFTISKPAYQTNTAPLVTSVTNGVPLLYQRVGANSPLLGDTNGTDVQWHFFVFTNTYPTNMDGSVSNTPYVALLTFMPPNLSTPRNYDADIDMYASTNAGLLTLDPSAVALADKSLKRGGSERLLYSNSVNGTVYYIGVKSEDAKAAEFGFMAVASGEPFSSTDADGNLVIRAVPMPITLTDGTPQRPQSSLLFFVPAGEPATARRVTVMERINHAYIGDLYGVLQGGGKSVVLNNHSSHGTNLVIFDDSGELRSSNNVPVVHSDGPGSLTEFMGDNSSQSWQFTMWDNAAAHNGAISNLTLVIAPRPDDPLDFYVTLPAGGSYYDYIDVPTDATNLNISVVYVAGDSKTDISLRKGGLPPSSVNGTNLPDVFLTNGIAPPGGSLNVSITNTPPLSDGRWFYELYNEGDGSEDNGSITLHVIIRISRSMTPDLVKTFASTNTPSSLIDDALTNYTIYVPDSQTVLSAQVGVRLDHPRVSDLALTLTSPQGTRVMLFEDRGGTNGTAMGFGTNGDYVYTVFTENTNLFPQVIKFAQPPYGSTNDVMTTNETIFASGFETNLAWNYAATNYTNFGTTNLVAGIYTNGQTVDGWKVASTNMAVVVYDPLFTATNFGTNYGSNYLALGASHLTRTVETVPGRTYRLNYAYRSGIANWWPADAKVNDLIDGGSETWTNINYTNGVVDNSFLFDGVKNYISLGTNVGNFGTNDFSIDFWARANGVQPSQVMNWWKADGNALDSVGNANGTVAGVDYAPAVSGQGFDFDESSIIDFGKTVGNFGTNDFIIDYWMRTDYHGNETSIMGKREGCHGGSVFWSLRVRPEGVLQFEVCGDDFGNSWTYGFSTNVVNDGVFHHVVAERQSTNFFLSVDGVVHTNFTSSILINFQNNASLLAGATPCDYGPDQSIHYIGMLDEIKFITGPGLPMLSKSSGTNGLNISLGSRGVIAELGDSVANHHALVTSEGLVNDGDFHHIAVVRHQKTLATYVDGLPSSAIDAGGIASITNTAPVLLGTNSSGLFKGQLDELDFFNRALAPSEIWAIYQAGADGKYSTFNPQPNAEIVIGGVTNSIHGNFTKWQTNAVVFTANSTNTTIELNGSAMSPVFDDLILEKLAYTNFANYFLAEESMDVFKGENAQGWWTLGIWDTRTGAASTNAQLLSWNLQLTFSSTNVHLGSLTNGDYSTNTVPGLQTPVPMVPRASATNSVVGPTNILYFAVDVPANASFATNIIESLDPSNAVLNVLYNASGLPTGDLPGDALLSSGSSNRTVLTVAAPPFLNPGQRYFLGVQNPNNAAVKFRLRVDFDVATVFDIWPLINCIGVTNSFVGVSNILQYYSFDVSPISSMALFEVYGITNGDVDLLLSKDLPPPVPQNFDYISSNPGTNNEVISVTAGSSPVPLSPGLWYLGVYNYGGTTNASYVVRASQWNMSLRTLTNCVMASGTVTTNSINYFAVDVPEWTYGVSNILTGSTNLQLIFNQYRPPLAGDTVLKWDTLTTNSASFYLTTNSSPVLQPGKRYYLWVYNPNATNSQDFQIQVQFVNPVTNNLVTLINGRAVSNSVPVDQVNYYKFTVPDNNASFMSLVVSNLTGNADLVVRKGLPVPDPYNFHYMSANSGLSTESIVVRPDSSPVPLTAGDWYLAVYNSDTTPVSYSVVATLRYPSAPGMVVLTNQIPFTNTLTVGAVQYFAVDVPGDAFSVTNILKTGGALKLIFNQDGLPTGSLPGDITLMTQANTNVLSSNSVPPLVAGQRYFLCVTNSSAQAQQFTLEADYGVAITPLTNNVAYTTSIFGTNVTRYYSYDVTTNATRVSFVLSNMTADLNLVARYGTPLPNAFSYDYQSTNSGATPESILIVSNSTPVALKAGRWYLGVYDPAGTNKVYYTIVAAEWDRGTNFVTATNGVSVTGSNPPNGMTCVAVDAPANAISATIYLNNETYYDPLTLLFNQYGLPSSSPGNSVLMQDIGAVVIYTNGPGITFQPGQRFYLGVVNPNSITEPFSLEVDFEFPPTITPLTNGVAFTTTNSGAPQYYSFQVPSDAALATFELRNLSGDVDLYLRKDSLPSLNAYDLASANYGTVPEALILKTNSTPIALTPGTWYLVVYNNEYAPVSYSAVAAEASSAAGIGTLNLVDLYDGHRRTNLVAGASGVGPALNGSGIITYYRFTVTNSAPAVAFVVADPDTSLDLLAKLGEFPTPQSFTAASIGSWHYTKLVFVATNSSLPSLNGDWYLAVPNNSTDPVTFDIAGTLLPSGSLEPVLTNLTTTTNGIGFSWGAAVLLPYSVDVSGDLPDFGELTNMVPFTNSLYFNDSMTNGPRRFYRVRTQAP